MAHLTRDLARCAVADQARYLAKESRQVFWFDQHTGPVRRRRGRFLVGRCSDRLGKSIRTSARDAMIADSSDPESRGIAFGFHRMMDTCGAVVGPLTTLLIIAALVGWSATLSARWQPSNPDQSIAHLPLKWLFFFSLIPGLIGAGFVIFGVKEVLPKSAKPDAGPPPIFQKYPAAFWKLILTIFYMYILYD